MANTIDLNEVSIAEFKRRYEALILERYNSIYNNNLFARLKMIAMRYLSEMDANMLLDVVLDMALEILGLQCKHGASLEILDIIESLELEPVNQLRLVLEISKYLEPYADTIRR